MIKTVIIGILLFGSANLISAQEKYYLVNCKDSTKKVFLDFRHPLTAFLDPEIKDTNILKISREIEGFITSINDSEIVLKITSDNVSINYKNGSQTEIDHTTHSVGNKKKENTPEFITLNISSIYSFYYSRPHLKTFKILALGCIGIIAGSLIIAATTKSAGVANDYLHVYYCSLIGWAVFKCFKNDKRYQFGNKNSREKKKWRLEKN